MIITKKDPELLRRQMMKKSITAAMIAGFELILSFPEWNSVLEMILAAVIFWGATLFLLIGMEDKKESD